MYASVKLSMLANVTIDDHAGINVISPMGRCRGKQYQSCSKKTVAKVLDCSPQIERLLGLANRIFL